MREFARTFYKSTAWQHCSKAYIKSVGGLCENCLAKGIYKPATMVHHITHLEPSNITNPEITMNYANLKALCTDCHAAEHAKDRRPYYFDDMGRVIER